jgi:K+-sensing histidine kinase KdpD
MTTRLDRWFVRTHVWSRPRKHRHELKPTLEPGPAPPSWLARALLLALAGALPLATAVLLVPLREDLDRATLTLVLVLPVVAVTILGGLLPGLVSAVVSALAFDVLLTQPYYSLTIDAEADVEASLVLAAIAVVISLVVGAGLRAAASSSARRLELDLVQEMIRAAARRDDKALVAAATQGLTDLVGLRQCEWVPGYRGKSGPVLRADGSLDGHLAATLPATDIEVPVHYEGRELGRLVLRPQPGTRVSIEERMVVLTAAHLLGIGLHARGATSRPRSETE